MASAPVPVKSNLKQPNYKVPSTGTEAIKEEEESAMIFVRRPTETKGFLPSASDRKSQDATENRDSVRLRFQNLDDDEPKQPVKLNNVNNDDLILSDPDFSAPGYTYNNNASGAVNDNLPESPSFPRSRFKSAFPVRGAFNHIAFLKHQNYTLSSKGFVTKRLDKIVKTTSVKNDLPDDRSGSRNKLSTTDQLASRSENSIYGGGKKVNPSFSMTRGGSSSKTPNSANAGGPLFEITKKKSRLAYRDKLIKDLQDIQRKLNVLEDRAIQMQEDQNKNPEEIDEVMQSTNLIQMTEDILEALVSINQRLETLGRTISYSPAILI